LGVDAKVDGNFDDIDKDAYYYEEIGKAKMLGITYGIGNNKFSPDASITRQDMMVLTERALRIMKKLGSQSSATNLEVFADKSLIAPYATTSIATLVREKLIVGSEQKIHPRDYEKILSIDFSHISLDLIGDKPFVELASDIAANCPSDIKKKNTLSVLRIAWALLMSGMKLEFDTLLEELKNDVNENMECDKSALFAEWTLLSAPFL
jgi:hypothetical protein